MGILSLFFAGLALAHHPHDPIDVGDISPNFAADRTLIASRVPAQNWRASEIVRSTDGGVSWWVSIHGMDHDAEIEDMALSPTFDTDGVAMVTTAGDGAFVTSDGADTWIPTLAGMELGAAAIATDGTDLVLLAHELGGPLWRSTDLGLTWTEALFPGDVYTMHGFGAEVILGEGTRVRTSQDAGVTWDLVELGTDVLAVGAGPGVRVVGTATGAMLSTAVGVFDPIPTATGAPGTEITAVAVSPSWPTDPYLILCELIGGPFVSEDGGATFTASPTGVALSFQDPLHYYSVRVSPNFASDSVVMLNTWEGLIVSHDRGQTWDELDSRPPGGITGIGVSPTHDVDGTVILGTFDAGLITSTDRGATWEVHNVGLTKSSIYDVDMGTDSLGAAVAMIGLRDQSGWGSPPWDSWELRPFVPQYSSRTALHPDYATTSVGLMGHRSVGVLRTDDEGFSWTDVVPGNMTAITSLAWSVDGAVAMAGAKAGDLMRSDDLGQTWTPNPMLPQFFEPVWLASGPDGFLIGTGEGVYTSVDGLTLAADPTMTGTVHQVAAAPDGTRFVSIRGGGFFRSDPGGSPWVEVGVDLSSHGSPHELVVSPTFATDGTVYAAIDHWLYRSDDRGDTFVNVGPPLVRYEEDAARYRSPMGQIRSITMAGASVDRVGLVLPGEWISLTFAGTGVRWLGQRGGGTVDVEIDGAVVATVDTAGTPVPQEVLFEDLGLADGVHTIRLVHTAGTDVVMDALDVFRAIPSGTPPTVDTGDTGDTGVPPTTTTPPTDEPTTDTGEGPTDEAPVTDDTPSDKGGCGCGASPPTAGWLLLPALALLTRRETR